MILATNDLYANFLKLHLDAIHAHEEHLLNIRVIVLDILRQGKG
eukprot:CAMPEP_0116889128 /NCGR_PEP_ID=MMETSP0463-20121206/24498_1 /TAXON_ID=181622 /ORGANISM="Strombidinopsis sp, Strain SopsisLIS2011" /LENGTH=43 /DNA_ID= /DNA_START= /DNA_END= /DNA_ORIENTATION=